MSSIESFKQEERVFNPPADFVNNAAISGMDAYNALCAEAAEDYEGFWARLAQQNVIWSKPFTTSRMRLSINGSRTANSTSPTTAWIVT
jgi:acetyl-CoA synthetase